MSTPTVVAQYVDRTIEVLRGSSDSLTVFEICDRMQLPEETVRRVLDVLVYLDRVRVSQRHVAGRRGAMPHVYAAA